MISWMQYDPQRQIASLDKPILIIQGDTDLQVAVADAEKLAAANSGAKKQIFTGMNHILKPAAIERQANFKTYNQPRLALQDGLTLAIAEFLQE